MEPNSGTLIDPATVLIGLGALVGLFAGGAWWKVWRSIDTSGDVVTEPDRRSLKDAAFLTAIALVLASGGYLLGEVVARLN